MFEIDNNDNLKIKTSALFENQDHVQKDASHAVQAACVAVLLKGVALRFKKSIYLQKRLETVKSKKLLDTLRREALWAHAQELKVDNVDDLQHQLMNHSAV